MAPVRGTHNSCWRRVKRPSNPLSTMNIFESISLEVKASEEQRAQKDARTGPKGLNPDPRPPWCPPVLSISDWHLSSRRNPHPTRYYQFSQIGYSDPYSLQPIHEHTRRMERVFSDLSKIRSSIDTPYINLCESSQLNLGKEITLKRRTLMFR